MYNWEDSFSQRVTLTRGGKAPQSFHRAPRARVACVRVLISVHFVLLQKSACSPFFTLQIDKKIVYS